MPLPPPFSPVPTKRSLSNGNWNRVDFTLVSAGPQVEMMSPMSSPGQFLTNTSFTG